MKKSNGFTLLEVMIVVLIVAILASIAVPSYARYVAKGIASSAAGDVYALSLSMENMYQRKLSYTAITGSTITDTAITTYTKNVWKPSQADNFTYSLAVDTTNSTYTIKAKGKVATSVAGCELTFSSASSTDRSVKVTDAAKCGGYSG